MLGLLNSALPAPSEVQCHQCVYPLQLLFVSSIYFRWELKNYISKDKAKQNRLTDTQNRQTNWCPLRGGHSAAVMLPHVNEEPSAGRLPSPGETKGKALHTPSPALVKANGNLAEELSQRTLKRLQSGAAWPEGCHCQWKDTLDPGSEVEGCVYSRKMYFPWEAGTNACCRLGSSASDSKHLAETLPWWVCGATENHWRG